MAESIATDSCHCQQLIRADSNCNLQHMVANSSKDDFAARLNTACDNASPVITSGRGRRAELRRRVANYGLDVSGESVRKWLCGESIPSMDNVRYLAKALSVHAEWLLTGRGQAFVETAKATDQASTPTAEEAAKTFDYFPSQYVRDVVTIMQGLDEDGQKKVLFAAQLAKHEFNTDRTRNSTKRVG